MDKKKRGGELVFGALLLLFGTLLLLDNVDIIDTGPIWRYWPFAIVAVGLNKILSSESRKELGGGVWLVFLGLWLFFSIYHVFGLALWDTWPMLLVAWGISEIWKAFPQRSDVTLAKENTHAR